MKWLFGPLLLLFLSACFLKDRDNPKPNKTVLTYTLSKLDKDTTYTLDSSDIKGLEVSGNGEWLYVIGGQKTKRAVLKSLEVGTEKWADALGSFKTIPKAENRSSAVDLSSHQIECYSDTPKGILFTLAADQGLVVLQGTGVDNAILYRQKQAGFLNGVYEPLFMHKGQEQYIYLLSQKPPHQEVLFRPYIEAPRLDKATWQKIQAPSDSVMAMAQDAKDNILFADLTGIKRLPSQAVGVQKNILAQDVKLLAPQKAFMFDKKTKNNRVEAMALVDNKFLVIGLKADSALSGGVAVADLSKEPIQFKLYGKGLGLTIHKISTERIKHRERTKIAAVLTTNKGFLFLDNQGEFMELVPGKGLLVNAQYINDNRAQTTDYEKAASGFMGDLLKDPGDDGYIDAAQTNRLLWYLVFRGAHPADNGGIFTLDIRSNQVEASLPPPVLPIP